MKMKMIHVAGALAALSLGNAAMASVPREAPVAVNTQGLAPFIAEQVSKNAQEGYTVLARYLERVRPYQHLSYEDVTRPKTEVPAQSQEKPREYRKHAIEWR